MKKLFIAAVSLFLLSCSLGSYALENVAVSSEGNNSTDQQLASPSIITVHFTDDIVMDWDTQTDRIIATSISKEQLKNRAILKTLIQAIANDESLGVSVCDKEAPLKKGDVAFIYLNNMQILAVARDLKMQFDVFENDCPYPYGLLDFLENDRQMVSKKLLHYAE